MDLRDRLVLGSRVAGALGRILADRLGEGLGRALPRTSEQFARPDVVNELLQRHAPAGATPLPPVRAVRLPGVDFESSNCRNFLIEVEFDGEGLQTEPLPKTVYVKLPCAELGTRAFANAVGFWEVEAAFCERVAARVPIRVPRVYAVARRGARFVLLLEDLQEIPGVRLFINRDMAAGTTPERARHVPQHIRRPSRRFLGMDPRAAGGPATRQASHLSRSGRSRDDAGAERGRDRPRPQGRTRHLHERARSRVSAGHREVGCADRSLVQRSPHADTRRQPPGKLLRVRVAGWPTHGDARLPGLAMVQGHPRCPVLPHQFTRAGGSRVTRRGIDRLLHC